MPRRTRSPMYKIVLLRHGESVWNRENRFTGWADVGLTELGLDEARQAATLLTEAGFAFEVAFTSVLKRAIKTLWTVLEEMDRMWIPINHSWRLNERHYGALQGLNKAETAAKFGDAQVKIWRRAYDTLGQKHDHRRARQQPARARQVSRQRLGRRDRRAQHPHRPAARLRARSRIAPDPQLLPR